MKIFLFILIIGVLPVLSSINIHTPLIFCFIIIFILFKKYKKIKQNKRKIVLNLIYFFFCIFLCLFQYTTSIKERNEIKYICEQVDNYKNIDDLKKSLEDKTKIELLKHNAITYHYMVVHSFMFGRYSICEINTNSNGNILSKKLLFKSID